jgi:hypothetical protein
MKPAMITCPASVPTEEEPSPETSSAAPKRVPDCGPRACVRPTAMAARSSPVASELGVWNTAHVGT